jgi:hypothetical protein
MKRTIYPGVPATDGRRVLFHSCVLRAAGGGVEGHALTGVTLKASGVSRLVPSGLRLRKLKSAVDSGPPAARKAHQPK